MDNQRLGIPKSDVERAATHFNVPITEVTGEMVSHVQGIPRGSGLERQIGNLSDEDIDRVAEAVVEKFKEVESLLLHSVPYVEGSPGIVVDQEIAARTSCRCARVDGSEICFSKGIIGGLSEEQKELYCNPKVYIKSPRLEQRIKRFKEAVAEAKEKIKDIPKGERLEPWLKAMSEELTERGIEI